MTCDDGAMAHPSSTRDVFVSRFNRWLAVLLWALVALVYAVTVSNDTTWTDRLLALVPTAFGAVFGWAVLWRPHMTVGDDGVEVVNVLRTVRVPWAALVHIDTRFALTLVTPTRKVAVTAAPAPGRIGVAVAQRNEQRSGRSVPRSEDGGRRAGDMLHTDSGDAAYLVRWHWDRLRDAGAIELGVADTVRVPVSPHWLTLAVLVATGIGGWFAIAAR